MSEVLARSERRSRQRAANRGAILAAARRVAEREGAHLLSLRATAAEAGYAPASVYAYFRNRAELVLALAGEELGTLARTIREAKSLSDVAPATLALVQGSAALAVAMQTLAAGNVPPEAERQFNGKLIAVLTALARTPARTREEQADVVLIAATFAGLALFARAGRLKALGFAERDLLARFIYRTERD